jgi:hypothetical protein
MYKYVSKKCILSRVTTVPTLSLVEDRQKLRGSDDFNRPKGFEVPKVMIPGNEIIGPARQGAFQNAVVRGTIDDIKGFSERDLI